MLLLSVLVAGVLAQKSAELIRSRAHHRGQYYCMRSPDEVKGVYAEGVAIELAVCNPRDHRQLWWRATSNGGGIKNQVNNMLLTLKHGREANGNPVEQRSSWWKQYEWNQWKLESGGRIRLAKGSEYSVHADLSQKKVVVRKQHSGSRHQAWDFIPYKEFKPHMTRNEAHIKAQSVAAKVRAWARRFSRGRRRLAATASTGRLLDAIEE